MTLHPVGRKIFLKELLTALKKWAFQDSRKAPNPAEAIDRDAKFVPFAELHANTLHVCFAVFIYSWKLKKVVLQTMNVQPASENKKKPTCDAV